MNTKAAIQKASHIIDLWLPEKMKADSIPGISVGIIHKGEIVFEAGYGFADVEKKIKPTSTTLYPIASISKMFTSIAILQLVEQKAIHLDDKIYKYIPWFLTKNKINSTKNITIKDLLEHTSGIWRDGNTYHWYDDKFPTELELKKEFNEKSIQIKRNAKFKYSNYGYALLGLIIETVSGVSYEQYIEKNISRKLGMSSTRTLNSKIQEDTIATGYGKFSPDSDREIFKNSPPTHTYTPAAGMVSNVKDLCTLLASFSNKKSILSPKIQKLMTKPLHKTDDNAHYGLGCDILTLGKRKLFGHSGSFTGFSLNIAYDPQDDIGVVILTNTHTGRAQGLCLGIFDTLFKIKDKKYSKYFNKNASAENKSFEGFYESRWTKEVIVAAGDHYLSLPLWSNFPMADFDMFDFVSQGKYKVISTSAFGMNAESVQFKKDTDNGKTILDYGSALAYKK